ncbi:MAG: hypothetical protein E6G44_12470 [Actinobacteria bacterium]|nr:MAG: hypothetical protein E6G44_12470 [Actinomycetota bacterium]
MRSRPRPSRRSRASAPVEPERAPEPQTLTQASAESVPPLLTDFASKVLAVKEGETFLYSDVAGNLDDRREFGHGLYHRDTRFLSHFRMQLSGRDPVLLSSSAERAYMSPAVSSSGTATWRCPSRR